MVYYIDKNIIHIIVGIIITYKIIRAVNINYDS